jgi:RNA polymerase sigma-70 factor (ECF subfamily)
LNNPGDWFLSLSGSLKQAAMADAPLTRLTLLTRIKNGQDAAAWTEFLQLYGPVVYRFARNRGLQDADAADVMQDVMRSVARNAAKLEYDPKRGTFRGWLYTIARNKVYNFLTAGKNRPKGSGDPDIADRLESFADPRDEAEASFELEYRRGLSSKAMDRVKSEFQKSTWQAFWETAVEGKNPTDVGKALRMTPGAVYVAKSRVLARLRDEVRQMETESEIW